MFDLTGKTALITGATGGIGESIATELYNQGATVILTGRKEDVLNTLKEKLGDRAYAIPADLSDSEKIKALIADALKITGKIDILINNAGISYIGIFQDMTYEEWNRIVNTNLGSVFNCSKCAVKMMLTPKQGKIINISSVWGCVGASTEVAYSATKGGINSFTSALAKELAPSNIQVNAVACGIIDTEMNSFLEPEELDAILEEVPAGRMGRPQEVADFIYNLTDGNDYLTGQVIRFDGGWI